MSRRKKGLITVLALLGVVLIASASAVALRKPVLQWAADYYLQQSGISASLTVAEVGFKQAVIEDLDVRETTVDRITADQVIIRFSPENLLSGVLPELEIHGLKILQKQASHEKHQGRGTDTSPDDERPPEGSSLSSPQDVLGNWEVSDIHLKDAEYTLVYEEKRYSLGLDALLQKNSQEEHDLQLTFHPIEDSEARVVGNIALSLSDLLPVSMEGNLNAAVPRLGIDGQISFSGRDIIASPNLDLNGTLQITKGDWENWTASLPMQDEQMKAILSLDGNVRLPKVTALADASGSLVDWIEALDAKGEVGLEIMKLSTPFDRRLMEGSVAADFLLENARFSLFLKGPASMSLANIKDETANLSDDSQSKALLDDSYSLHLSDVRGERPFIEVNGLSSTPRIDVLSNAKLKGAQGARLSGRLSGYFLPRDTQFEARLENLLVKELPLEQLGSHEISGEASLSGTYESYDGHAKVSATSEGFNTPYGSAGNSAAELFIGFHGRGTQKLEVSTKEPGMARAKGLSLPAGLGIPESELKIGELNIIFQRNEGVSDFHLGINGKAELQDLTFRQFRTSGAPLTGQVRPLSVDFEVKHDSSLPPGQSPSFTATGKLQKVTLDEPGLSLADLSFEAEYPLPDQETPLLQVTEGLLSSTADPAIFSALDLNGPVFLRKEALAFSLAGIDPNSKVNVTAEGSHSLETGNGSLDFSLPSHRFLINGLQPTGLFPMLDLLEDVEGDAALSLNIAWNDYGLNGRGRLFLNGLDFSVFDAGIKNLNSTMELGSLLPLRTAQSQVFTVETAGIGNIQLTDILGRFELAEGQTTLPVVKLDNLRSNFADGGLHIEDSEFDLSKNRHKLILRLENISISQLVDLLEIEDLEAAGRFTGEIPVTISDGAFEISDGHLESSQTGQIAFKSDEVRSALASGGEAVSLMLDALENFHYDRLRLDIHKPIQGESRLAIKLEGQNPDVLDGHPFDLNINMNGDLASVLQAIAEGRRLSQNVLDDMLELVQ
ncbi:MAG: intermembrane phospholipid transport protein YdbH family protein [Pseudomonadota bacterium]